MNASRSPAVSETSGMAAMQSRSHCRAFSRPRDSRDCSSSSSTQQQQGRQQQQQGTKQKQQLCHQQHCGTWCVTELAGLFNYMPRVSTSSNN
jgi:hypothetical protein